MEFEIFDVLNILLILYILFFTFKNNKNLSNFTMVKKNNKKPEVIDNSDTNKEIDNAIYKKRLENRDRSVINDSLVAPEQRHESHNYVKMDNVIKINEYTRGGPENYQVVGLLYKQESDKKYQLFGRRTYPGSPDWEYFIGGKDSGGLDYKYPLDNKKEIYDNSTIVNPIDNDTYQVKIYNYDKPRYIPF